MEKCWWWYDDNDAINIKKNDDTDNNEDDNCDNYDNNLKYGSKHLSIVVKNVANNETDTYSDWRWCNQLSQWWQW